MAFSVSTTTLGGNTARLITGSGNLDDLATALASDGVTKTGRTLVFAGTGAATYYRMDGTLTEQRNGVWTIIISTNSFVCWSGSGATTTFGLVDSSGARTSRVDIVYGNASLAAGADPYSSAEYRCFAGAGTLIFNAGSLSFECSSRSDMDVRSTATSVQFDAVDVQQVSPSSYGHIMTSGNVTTTAKTRFALSPEWLEFVSGVNTVNPISLDLGVRVLNTGASTTINVISPQYPQFNFFGATAGAQANVKNPVVNYMKGSSAAVGVVNILRTLYATFTDQLGAAITSPAPNLITVKPDASTATTAFSAGAASYDALQSYTADSVAYTETGTGYTDLGTYDFYAVGFGYASQYKTVNVKTAHNGNSGIAWAATSVKSSLVTTAYGSVTTSGFSLNTGTDLLTISASRTAKQAAEYLFKHAYDNPTSSYWLTLNHTPVTVADGVIDFGTLDITVNDGYVFTTDLPIDFSGGTLSTEFSSGSNYTYTGGNWLQAATIPTFTGGTVNIGAAGTYAFNTVGGTIVSMTPAAPGTYTMSAVTATGVLDLRNTTAHAITVALPVSVSTTTANNTGGTITVDTPQPTLDATVLSGSRVVLYNNTTAAELDNTAPAGTTWSKTITGGATVGDTLVLHVFKEGYEEFSTSFIYSGSDTTLLVSQTLHAAIQSLRTELGISDYTTITEFTLDITGTVEIDADDADGNTQKARLAIWYNGVLTTEAGARYLRGAITVLSTAAIRINVATLDLQLTNVSVTYGLNFTDTERRLYRSDGTPIYSATSAAGSIQNDYSGVPDTVETGVSGLTGSESAQLMALPSASDILTAAAASPISANIKKVNDVTVGGSGTEADPWGPA